MLLDQNAIVDEDCVTKANHDWMGTSKRRLLDLPRQRNV